MTKRSRRSFADLAPSQQNTMQGMGVPRQRMPLGRALRKMAETVLHDRVVIKERRSTRPPAARFTDDQVRLLRRLHQGGVLPRELAVLCNMGVDSMKQILDGRNYSSVL